jgi:hypothetical protein
MMVIVGASTRGSFGDQELRGGARRASPLRDRQRIWHATAYRRAVGAGRGSDLPLTEDSFGSAHFPSCLMTIVGSLERALL